MWNALLLVDRHLVGADIEAAIDGGRVAGHDFAPEPPCESNGERALSRGGGTEYRDENGLFHYQARKTA
ncbi:MAG TPA: hypothetical protein VM791_07735, partial [Vicinamibacterales bacterium]|nr:hypothetical protein [Vicinamibacterales bacterium]